MAHASACVGLIVAGSAVLPTSPTQAEEPVWQLPHLCRARLQPCRKVRRIITALTGCGKTKNSVILSEAKNLSLFLFLYLNRREILRFAQNDRTRPFFRSLFSVWGLVLAIFVRHQNGCALQLPAAQLI